MRNCCGSWKRWIVSTNGRGDLEMVVRETLEAVALG